MKSAFDQNVSRIQPRTRQQPFSGFKTVQKNDPPAVSSPQPEKALFGKRNDKKEPSDPRLRNQPQPKPEQDQPRRKQAPVTANGSLTKGKAPRPEQQTRPREAERLSRAVETATIPPTALPTATAQHQPQPDQSKTEQAQLSRPESIERTSPEQEHDQAIEPSSSSSIELTTPLSDALIVAQPQILPDPAVVEPTAEPAPLERKPHLFLLRKDSFDEPQPETDREEAEESANDLEAQASLQATDRADIAVSRSASDGENEAAATEPIIQQVMPERTDQSKSDEEEPTYRLLKTSYEHEPSLFSGWTETTTVDNTIAPPLDETQYKRSGKPDDNTPSTPSAAPTNPDAIAQFKEDIKAAVKDLYPKPTRPERSAYQPVQEPIIARKNAGATPPEPMETNQRKVPPKEAPTYQPYQKMDFQPQTRQPLPTDNGPDDFSQLKRQLVEVLQEINPKYKTENKSTPQSMQANQTTSPGTPAEPSPIRSPQPDYIDLAQLKKRLHSAMQSQAPVIMETPWSIAELSRTIIDTFKLKLQSLTQERDTLEKTVDQLRIDCKTVFSQLTAKTKACEEAESVAQERTTLAQQLMDAMTIVSAERDQAMLTIAGLKKHQEMQNQLLGDAEKVLNWRNDQLERSKAAIADLNEELSRQSREIEMLHTQLAHRTAQRDELQERATTLENELQSSTDSQKALSEIRRMLGEANIL